MSDFLSVISDFRLLGEISIRRARTAEFKKFQQTIRARLAPFEIFNKINRPAKKVKKKNNTPLLVVVILKLFHKRPFWRLLNLVPAMRKSKYKSRIIKQRKTRLLRELDQVMDEVQQAVALDKIRQSAEVERLLAVSPDYADLNHFCLKVMSLYEDLVFSAVAFDAAHERLLYTFDSDADWSRVKEFFTDWFSKQGWEIIDESDDLPHYDKIVVNTDKYKIRLCDVSMIRGYLLTGEKK